MQGDYILAMLRTQISLPEKLRREIDKDRRRRNESLSEYLRKAAKSRMAGEREKKARLAKLANEVIGKLDLSKYPHWSTERKIPNWQRKLRREKGI